MTTTTPIPPTPRSAPPPAAPATPPAGGGAITGGDFETFLRMLTTQITNQDPLNPMEGSDFAVQLATFSGVEQQVRTNQLLEGMGGTLGGASLSQYADWIGREVRATAPTAFGTRPITLDIAPDSRADRVVLLARDRQGTVVTREEIGTTPGEVDWFGRDALGAKLPDGRYSFTIENWKGGERLSETPVASYARVSAAKLSPTGPVLVLEGGSEVPAASVTALREAQG